MGASENGVITIWLTTVVKFPPRTWIFIISFLKLVPSFGEFVWPFGNFFVSYLCIRLFNISFIYSPHVFELVKCKAWGFFGTAFHCCLLISHLVFCSVSHRRSLHPNWFQDKAIACIWKFFKLVVFSSLHCPWSIFYTKPIGVSLFRINDSLSFAWGFYGDIMI